MENPLIQQLRDSLSLPANYRSEKHPDAEAIVMASQSSVKAALDELDLLRATPGGATEIHVLDNGCHVTGERAANLLDDERASHKRTINDYVKAEQGIGSLKAQLTALTAANAGLKAEVERMKAYIADWEPAIKDERERVETVARLQFERDSWRDKLTAAAQERDSAQDRLNDIAMTCENLAKRINTNETERLTWKAIAENARGHDAAQQPGRAEGVT